MKFSDIKCFTKSGNYEIDVPLDFLEKQLKQYEESYGLELNPDFQRGNVWTEEQQIAWLEFFFKGGKSSRVIYFNCPHFRNNSESKSSTICCVDGLQRLTAIRRFLNNEIPIFGYYLKDFDTKHVPFKYSIRFNINDLQTKREVLQWYIDMNSGGTVHSDSEIDRVKKLLKECKD